jgi:predicted PurR-regulated permease PerM
MMRKLGRIKSQTRATVGVVVIAALVFAPVAMLTYFAALEIGQAVENWEANWDQWQAALVKQPRLAAAWEWISQNFDVRGSIGQLAGAVHEGAMAFAAGVATSLIQALIALFVLFYLYRDEDRVLSTVRQLSPLTNG